MGPDYPGGPAVLRYGLCSSADRCAPSASSGNSRSKFGTAAADVARSPTTSCCNCPIEDRHMGPALVQSLDGRQAPDTTKHFRFADANGIKGLALPDGLSIMRPSGGTTDPRHARRQPAPPRVDLCELLVSLDGVHAGADDRAQGECQPAATDEGPLETSRSAAGSVQ